MNNLFKSAMDNIKADEILKKKTEVFVMKALSNNVKTQTRSRFVKRVIAASCAAVLLVGTSAGAYAYYKTPVSYVSLDINPSVELGVNPFDKVVSATAYNEDGQTILNGQDVLNSDVKDAIGTLVTSASDNGFVDKDGSTVISVTAETDNSADADKLESEAAEGASDAVKSDGKTAEIQKDNVALARRDEAKKLGITPGKLNLIQKLQALDPSITVDQYKDAKVKDIMKKFVELKKAQNGNTESSSSSTGSSSAAVSASSVGTSSKAVNDNDNNSGTAAKKDNSKSQGSGKAAGKSAASAVSDSNDQSAASSTISTNTDVSTTVSEGSNGNNNGKSDSTQHGKSSEHKK
ncbi:MAG TPA: hypothetical protein VHO66_06525 [Ruminiclostridium sp.]|nr:hypothetical protein [Ruminiclostridium sp.]